MEDGQLLKAMQKLPVDIAEIKTSLKHISADMQELKGSNKTLNDDVISLKSITKENTKDIDRLFEKSREREQEEKVNRRWIIGTAIGSFLSIASIIVAIIAIFTKYI